MFFNILIRTKILGRETAIEACLAEPSAPMETGVSYNKQRLHKVRYLRELLSTNDEVNESIRPLLRVSRDSIVRTAKNGVCAGQFPAAGPFGAFSYCMKTPSSVLRGPA
jgi:hypothetical protein